MSDNIDLIELSDWFRRQKPFVDPANEDSSYRQSKEIVSLTREFAAALTYYHGELPAISRVNRWALKDLWSVVEKMDVAMKDIVADEIILPASAALPFAETLKSEVMRGTRFALQTEAYTKDLSVVGPIYPEVRTVLDEGYRGLCDIDQELKYRWDAEMREGGQLSMEI